MPNKNKKSAEPINNVIDYTQVHSPEEIQRVNDNLKNIKSWTGTGIGVGQGDMSVDVIPEIYKEGPTTIKDKLTFTSKEREWSPFNLPKDIESVAHFEQTASDILAKSFKGFVPNFLGGFIKAVASNDPTGHVNMLEGSGGYSNWFNDIGDQLLRYGMEKNHIFQNPTGSRDGAWLGQGFQQSGLSVGIMAEAAVEQLIAQSLSAATFGAAEPIAVAAAARKVKLLSNLKKVFATGMLGGAKEAWINASETGKTLEEKLRSERELGLNTFTDEEIYEKSMQAASIGYKTEILPLMLMNGLIFSSLFGKVLKGNKLSNLGEYGVSGAFESGADYFTRGIKNKYLKSIAKYSLPMVGESIEEGWQTGNQKYAIGEVTGEHQDYFDREMQDSMLIGGLSGGMFNFIGSGFRGVRNWIDNKRGVQTLDYLHNQFLNESPKRFANSYESKVKAEENLKNAIINHDKQNSKESKFNMEKAAFEYENAQRNSQAQGTLDALHLDYITGKETAFESHIEQMQNIHDAVVNNDTKALTQYGLLDEKGEERFKGSFDLVKSTFTKNIEDAKQIKSMLEDNIGNITSDFESAWVITQNQFNTKESLNALNETYNDAKSYLANNIQYQQLSEDGKQRFNIENEIDVLESMGNLSERNQDRLISLKEDLSNLENAYTKSDKNLLDTINKESVLSSYMGAYLYNEQIDNNNKQLKDLVNKKKIQEKIEERKEKVRKKKASKATKEDKEDVKESIAKEEGELTEKDVAAVETAAVENNVNPKEQLKAELESPLFSASEFNIPAFNENQSAEFNDSLNLQPHIFESNNESHNKVVDKYVQAITKLNEGAKNRNISTNSSEVFNIIADHTGLDTAYKNFNLFKEAYKKSGLPYNEEDLDKIYSDMFGSLANIFDVPTPVTSVTPQQVTSNKVINEEKQAMEIVSHKTLEDDGVVYTGPKVIEPVLKMAFKGVEYTEVFNPETGRYERKDADTLLRDGLYDIDTIVNPNQLLVGETVNAMMDMNWVHPKGFEKGSKEWLAEVPIIGIYNGKAIGPIIHSVSWWNTNNVGDFTYNPNLTEFERQERQKDVIQKAREYHSNLRQSIFNNDGKGALKISKKVLGFESNNYGQLYNVNTTVPNATIGALKYDSKTGEPIIIIGSEKVFNGVILNSLDYTDSDGNKKAIGVGTTMMIKQVGLNENNQPTYIAYPVLDNNNQETLKELRKSRGKIYDAIDAINKNKQVGNISVEMANKILDDVSKITKVPKSKLLEVSEGKHIGMDNINYLYPENMREDRSKLRMGFSSKGVGKQVPIINDDNSVSSKSYEEVLKEQLYTQHKFYEINTPQGKDYVLYPQPRIEFTSEEVDTKAIQEFIPTEDRRGVIVTEQTPLENFGVRESNAGKVTSTKSLDNGEIEAKKADIERRRQETNNKNEEFWEQFTSINAEEVADRDNLINKLTKDIKLPVNTRINNWVLEELNGKLWEGKNIRGKEEEYFGKENWDKIKEAKNQFDIEFKKIEDSNLAKIKLIEQKQSDLLSTIDGLELRKAWSFGLIEEPNVVGLDETNFISKKTEFKNGDLVETDNYEGYYYLSKPNKDDEWYEQIIGKTEQEVEDKINAKYDAEYVGAVKKGELTKEQAMKALEEVGRKDSSAYAELAALDNNTDENKTEEITEISNSQTSLVKQEFFNIALKDIYKKLIEDPKAEISNKDITKIVIDSFDNHIESKVISVDKDGNKTLFKDVHPQEYAYLKSVRNSLLGLNEDGTINNDYTSIIKSVGDFINQELADIVDTEGFNEKTTDRAAYEVNVKTTLGLKAKLLLAGRSVLPQHKVIRESFGGFQEYYKIDDIYDALQQILSNNDNDVFSAANKIDDWIKINEKEFGFLESVKDIFLKSDTPIDVKKQLLYRLNQTKNQMFFGLYSKTKNGWRLQSMNSNSREPNIVVQNYYNTNLKTNSPLVTYSKKGFKLNEDVADRLLNQYNSWKNKNSLADVTAVELGNWLSNFGIDADPVTLEKYKRANNSAFSPNSSLHGRLAENLKEFLKKQKDSIKSNPNFIFNTEDKDNMSFKGKSILQYETSKFLKDFIQLEIANTFHTLKSMYIAGKTINTYSQPNFASLQVDKLKDKFDNKGLKNELKQAPFSKNSLLLSLLDNDRIREGLAVSYVSLNPLKQRGQKIYNDDGITAMYAGDREASLLSHFMTSEAEYGEINGIKYRGAKMSSAALSDSSQLFLLHLPVLNLTKGNFEFENGEIKLTDDILELLFSQLIKPDIDRIEAFLKANTTTNTIGKDFASQIITTFPELNTLVKGDSFLLEDLHKAVLESKSVDEVISKYKAEIFDFIQTYVKSGAESKFSYKDNTASGDWVKYDFIKSNGKEVNILDKDYLDKRNGVDVKENVTIAAYDYFINYMISQSQWQMLFAGDYTNYFKDADKVFEKSSLTGLPKVFSIKNLKLKSDEKLVDKLKEQYITFEKKAKVDLSKRLKEQISPGNRLADSSNKKEGGTEYIQLMISDVELPSNTLSHIVSLWYNPSKEDLENIDKLQSLITNQAKAEYNNNEEEYNKIDKEINSIKKDLQSKFPDVADYMKITGTDAQEYTTWREHLNILYNQGNITKEDYDNIKKKLKSQSKDGVNNENKLTKDEKKVVFQPIKPLHTGMYFSDVNGFKDQRFVYVKTSSFPLLPETTTNSELDGVRKNMEKLEKTLEKPVRASYQTGNKVGAIKNTISFNRLANPDIDVNELTSSSMILDRANFSIQQDKPFKTDKNIKNNKRDEVNRGTQFEDIILGNGINHIEDTIFPNLFDDKLISDLGIEVKDNNISGVDLYRIYNHIYEQEQELLKKQLYNSLGLDSNGEWEDSIQSLEAIRDLLKKQLSNQQDKEILDLVYVVPTKDANGKLYNRYLSKEEVDNENAKPTRADFKLPLWITPNSQKFESVLNAIVGNKLIKLKMPGFSSPVASEQGFKYLEEKDYNKGGIIYTNAYDPKKGLQATYIEDKDGNKVLHKAQVLVASKFRDSNGNLMKIPTTKDGLVDMEKIDKDLLSMFSFRIPTSAHQSGAIIEIVGFLPHEQGDLMIVPKDHTTQIGEDYDIDTRYVYGFNTFVDRDGKLRRITVDSIEDDIKELEKRTNNKIELKKYCEALLNKFKVFNTDDELQQMFEDETIDIIKKKEATINKLRQLPLENNITNLFKSIYSTTNPEIQKSISATLSTKFAEDTASLIDDKISTGTNYSIYDDRHQSRVMMLGASGKMGIGVHSNWVVLNSLFQQVPISDKPQLIKGYDEDLNPIPFTMTFGNFKTNGILGLTDKNELAKIGPSTVSITTANMINQNSATDNQKLQIMGRRNENKYTINVFALMTNLGIIDETLSNGKTVGYPDLFISQPIIRRYADLKAKYDSITSEYNPDVEKEIKDTLLKEFGNNVKWAIEKDEDGNETEMVGYMDRTKYNSVSNDLTAQTLYDNLVQGDGAYLNENQWAVYEKFMELDKQGREVSKLQQLLNIEGQGLGVSYFDVIVKKDNIMSDFLINNATKMLGNFATAKSTQEKDDLESKGYITLTTEFIKDEFGNDTLMSIMAQPTTPQNRKLINSTANAYNLWKNIFPFENTAISEQIDRIFALSEVNPNTKKGQELRYDTLRGIQDYFYSYRSPINSIFESDINIERERLFMTTNGNVPLANYLFLLKNKKHPIFQESFFRDLEFNIGYDGEESIIEYNLSEKSNFNKNEAYKILEELSNDNRPIEDGKPYTYSDLVKDLTKYSMLSNQENGAIGFRQYIPTSILEKYGVIEGLRTVTNIGAVESHSKILNGLFLNLKKDLISLDNNEFVLPLSSKSKFDSNVAQINSKYGDNTVRVKYVQQDEKTISGVLEFKDSIENMNKSVFIKQFVQHNPKYAKTINLKEDKKNWTIKDNVMISKTGYEKEFIKVRDSESSSWLLFEHKGEGVYNRIETLGTFGVNEYSPFDYNKTSLFEDNKFGNSKKTVSQSVPPSVKSNTNLTAKQQIANQPLSKLIESISSKDSKFSEIAKLLLPFVQNKKVNVINLSEVRAKGAYIENINDTTGGQVNHPKLGLLNRGEIYLDENLVNTGNSEEIRYALIEETLHSITAEEVSKYIDSSKTTFDINGSLQISWRNGFNEINAPIHITKLLSIYQQAGSHIISELKSGILTKGQQVEQLNNSTTFENKINRILNLKEFIVGVTTDEDFRDEMSKVKYNGKSVLSRFAQVIRDILNKLLKSQGVENSITENGFNTVMEMLDYRSKNTAPTFKEDVTIPSLIEKAEKLSNEVPSNNIENRLILPKYNVDKNLKNSDGSKRFASTNGINITINPVNSIEEFFNYFEGKEGGITSQQKALVLFELTLNGYNIDKIKSILNTKKLINTFLILHEQDHIDNKDKDVYWKNGKDLLTKDKIQIEVRATINALKQIESNSNKIEINLQPNMNTSEIIDILLSNNILTKINC
jgi:hypothetical protein